MQTFLTQVVQCDPMGLLQSGKGSMILDLDAHDVKPGDSLTGRITFTLDKSAKSGGIFVVVRAREQRVKLDLRDSDLHDKKYVTVFEAREDLEGRKEYEPGDHGPFEFSIRVPDLTAKKSGIGGKLGGLLGKATKGIAALTGGDDETRWEIYAEVDLKGGWDLRDTKRIHVA